MHDGFFGAVFGHQAHGVVGGFAGVDNQRQAALVGGLDVGDEAVVLPGQIAAAPVVVEAGFADADHFGVACVLQKFVQAEFGGSFAVGVDADGGEEVVVLFGQCQHLGETFAAHADDEGLGDLVVRHVGEDFGQAAGEAVEIQVAVGVDEEHSCSVQKGLAGKSSLHFGNGGSAGCFCVFGRLRL